MSDTFEFKDAMDKWITIKKQLASVRKDIKTLNTEEKRLRTFVKSFMVVKDIQVCNVEEQKAKVSVSTKKTKSPFNRELVRKGLLKYFRGDDSLVTKVFELIDEEIEVRETDTISLKLNK